MNSALVEAHEIKAPTHATPSLRKDREFWFVLATLTAAYVGALVFEARRFVWFDELCTFYIARAGSLHQLWQWVLKFDNNPPTVYLLSRFSMAIFGPTSFGLRLPSMLEFYLGSVGMLLYLRRKMGNSVAAFGVMILWSSASFRYATEARVYALVFMSFSFLLLSWDTATKAEDRTLALWGVAVSNLVLLAAHVFAPLCLLPFLAAELVRYWRRRKPDYPLYAALVLPMAMMLIYIPLIRVYQGLMLWPQSHASFRLVGMFYYNAFDCIARAIFLVILLWIGFPFSRDKSGPNASFLPEDLAVFVCVSLNPLLLNLVLMSRNGDFFDRYTLTTDVVIYGVLAVILARRMRFGRTAAYAATLVMLILLAHRVQRDWLGHPRQLDPTVLASLRPDLPIVDSNGATFVEMNYHESPQVVSRLYYVKDRTAAINYDHTNYYYDFEALDDMKRDGLPLKGNIESYSTFVARHRQFLIYADPYEWLPLKLRDDGATFTLLRDFSGPSLALSGTIPGGHGVIPHISYLTPDLPALSPYIAQHVFLVTMPAKH